MKGGRQMVPFASYNEMESLGLQIATEYMKKSGKSRVRCFDITGFITDYLHLKIEYVSFVDIQILGFLGDGKTSVKIYENREEVNKVFDSGTVVIDSFLLAPSESARLRFTLAHEAAHHIMRLHSPKQSETFAAYKSSTASPDLQYTFEDLQLMFNLNESFADRLAAAILMPSDRIKKEILSRTGSAKVKVYGDGIISENDKIILNKIKDTFGVSYSAIYTRLKDLSLFEQHSFEEYCGSVLGFGI